MRKSSKIFKWIAGVSAGAVLSILIGYRLGEQAGHQALARFQTVWPAFLAMPVDDRALLFQAARKCDLNQEPLERQPVLECLRRGAQAMDHGQARLAEIIDSGISPTI